MLYSTNLLIHNLKKAITGIFSVHVFNCAWKSMLGMILSCEVLIYSYICTQHFSNDTSTLQIPPTHLSLMSYLEPFCCVLISIFRSQRFRHSYMDIYSRGVISIDTKQFSSFDHVTNRVELADEQLAGCISWY
jgi:hypothetical protein